jgi:hypothetical protein
MALFLEENQIVGGFPPVDMQTTANNGDYVNLSNYQKVTVLFWSVIGTAGDDPTVTFQQASDVAGTGVKALNPDSAKAFKKQAATNLLSTGAWADASADISTNTWTNADSAEQETLVAIDIDADELDVDNDFNCIRATVADVGSNAQLGALVYILSKPRFPAAAANMLSAIA